jgi:hypothetical protein
VWKHLALRRLSSGQPSSEIQYLLYQKWAGTVGEFASMLTPPAAIASINSSITLGRDSLIRRPAGITLPAAQSFSV